MTVGEALDGMGLSWLEAFADQGFEDIAGVVALARHRVP